MNKKSDNEIIDILISDKKREKTNKDEIIFLSSSIEEIPQKEFLINEKKRKLEDEKNTPSKKSKLEQNIINIENSPTIETNPPKNSTIFGNILNDDLNEEESTFSSHSFVNENKLTDLFESTQENSFVNFGKETDFMEKFNPSLIENLNEKQFNLLEFEDEQVMKSQEYLDLFSNSSENQIKDIETNENENPLGQIPLTYEIEEKNSLEENLKMLRKPNSIIQEKIEINNTPSIIIGESMNEEIISHSNEQSFVPDSLLNEESPIFLSEKKENKKASYSQIFDQNENIISSEDNCNILEETSKIEVLEKISKKSKSPSKKKEKSIKIKPIDTPSPRKKRKSKEEDEDEVEECPLCLISDNSITKFLDEEINKNIEMEIKEKFKKKLKKKIGPLKHKDVKDGLPNFYVHEFCVSNSPECSNSNIDIQKAITRGRKNKCFHCKKRGATVLNENKNFHVTCLFLCNGIN
jgi:hypothetical protein